MISPSSTNPKVTRDASGKPRRYIFRVCFIDPFQGTVMAKFARETLKKTRAAILRDIKNDYSVGLANYFTREFKKRGGTIVADVPYSEGDKDFRAQLTAIKSHNPDCVFVPGYYNEAGSIARQARELGIRVPLLGGDGWDSPKLTEIGRDAINGCYFSNHYSHEDRSARVQDFVKSFKREFRETPNGLAALGYDAARVLFQSMERAKELDGTKLADAIAGTKNFKGVTGDISINQHHDAVKPAVVLEVRGGQFKYVTTINPS
jgi:branched-chain amino acid transport system substrate-binding protein